MNKITFFIISILLSTGCKEDDAYDFQEQIIYEINENGAYQDFLTPNYYNANPTELRNEINKFVHFVRLGDYQHPFQNTNGVMASYLTNREFGEGIGLNGTSQHHPAIDLHPTNPTDIFIYATHDGIVNTYRGNSTYRHYLTITKEIKDSENRAIGKLVSFYVHIDLDLDESEALHLDGLYINKGGLVSKNLYSETMGGPHLHFEIRFYRNSEVGNEDFYNWQNNSPYTIQSTGIWSFGFWHSDLGYGFGNPLNLGIE